MSKVTNLNEIKRQRISREIDEKFLALNKQGLLDASVMQALNNEYYKKQLEAGLEPKPYFNEDMQIMLSIDIVDMVEESIKSAQKTFKSITGKFSNSEIDDIRNSVAVIQILIREKELELANSMAELTQMACRDLSNYKKLLKTDLREVIHD